MNLRTQCYIKCYFDDKVADIYVWIRMHGDKSVWWDCLYVNQYIIQISSGITHGRVLSGELYAQRLQKLIYLYFFTDCFMKISSQSLVKQDINIQYKVYWHQMRLNIFWCIFWELKTCLVYSIDTNCICTITTIQAVWWYLLFMDKVHCWHFRFVNPVDYCIEVLCWGHKTDDIWMHVSVIVHWDNKHVGW